MAFSLPDLPYAYDALEPHIDARTMEIHHSSTTRPTWTTRTRPSRAPSGRTSRSRKYSRTSTRCPRTSAVPSATTPAGTRTTRSSGTIMGPGRRRGAERRAGRCDRLGVRELRRLPDDDDPERRQAVRLRLELARLGRTRGSRRTRRRTRTPRSWRPTRRSSGSTSGSTPTTSTTRTAVRTTSRRGGTSVNWDAVAARYAGTRLDAGGRAEA